MTADEAGDIIAKAQALVGVTPDRRWGTVSQAALDSIKAIAESVQSTMNTLPSNLPWTAEIDGPDLVVRSVLVTAFGGVEDVLSGADNGETESGIYTARRVNGQWVDTMVKGCALPIRSTEAATRNSPLAFKGPHIPWGTRVRFWAGDDEANGIEVALIDNGPDVLRYEDHAGDLTKAAAAFFAPEIPLSRLTSEFGMHLSFRIIGGAAFVS